MVDISPRDWSTQIGDTEFLRRGKRGVFKKESGNSEGKRSKISKRASRLIRTPTVGCRPALWSTVVGKISKRAEKMKTKRPSKPEKLPTNFPSMFRGRANSRLSVGLSLNNAQSRSRAKGGSCRSSLLPDHHWHCQPPQKFPFYLNNDMPWFLQQRNQQARGLAQPASKALNRTGLLNAAARRLDSTPTTLSLPTFPSKCLPQQRKSSSLLLRL